MKTKIQLNGQRGFFKFIFSVIIIIAILAYFRVDIKNIAESGFVREIIDKIKN